MENRGARLTPKSMLVKQKENPSTLEKNSSKSTSPLAATGERKTQKSNFRLDKEEGDCK